MKKFVIIFWLFILILLCSCSKKEPSTAIAENASKEIVQVQEDIKKSTCENKSSFIARLDSIRAEIKNIDLACKTEKDVLKQENSKLKIIIGSLVLIIILSVYVIIKKRV